SKKKSTIIKCPSWSELLRNNGEGNHREHLGKGWFPMIQAKGLSTPDLSTHKRLVQSGKTPYILISDAHSIRIEIGIWSRKIYAMMVPRISETVGNGEHFLRHLPDGTSPKKILWNWHPG